MHFSDVPDASHDGRCLSVEDNDFAVAGVCDKQ